MRLGAQGTANSNYGNAEWAALATLLGIVLLIFIARAAWRARTTAKPRADEPRKRTFVLLGYDGRISTSKTIAAVWTLVLAFMVLAILYVATAKGDPGGYLVSTFGSPNKNSNLLYLIFLGGPYAAAVLAKVAVSSQVNSGSLQKSSGDPSPLDVVSDDSGATDLYDLQYTLFNLIVMVAVLALFLPAPEGGLPSIPDFLAMLTGGSALTYTFNKAAAGGNAVSLVSLAPGLARVGDQVVIYGQNLTVPAKDQQTIRDNTVVKVGGQKVTTITDAQPNQVAFTVPAYPGGPWPAAAQDVELKTNGNDYQKSPAALSIIGRAPVIDRVEPRSISAKATAQFKVRGSWFCTTDPTTDIRADAPEVTMDVGSATLLCEVANAASPNRDKELLVNVPDGLKKLVDAANPTPASVTVTRSDNASSSFGDLSVIA